MKAQRLLASTELAALVVNSAGDLLSRDDPTFPRPRVIVGILGLYGMLGLLASLGRGAARFAAAAGVVAFITSLVVGPGGRHAISLLNRTSTLVGGPPS